MKKLTTLIAAASMLLLAACGDTKNINGVEYETYGLFTMNKANSDIEYSVVWQNVVWATLLAGTVVVPILLVGLDIMEPEYKKCPGHVPGTVPAKC